MHITEYLESKLYESKTSPADYAKDYGVSHSVTQYPRVIEVALGTTLHNPKAEEETGKRKAFKYYPWIKYWQAFTKIYSNKLYCTCCGNEIFADSEAQDCRMFFNTYYKAEEGGTVDDLQAMGGHFYKNLLNPDSGYMIAPVCRSCNKIDSVTPMKVIYRNKFVEERADHIED